jgi:diguanylate cyclase (GGDEF)-like protein
MTDLPKAPGGLTLFRKLVLASIVVGLLPIIMGFSLSYFSQRNNIQKTMGSAFEVLARETGTKLSLLIHDLVSEASELARANRVLTAVERSNRSYLGMGPDATRKKAEREAAAQTRSMKFDAMDRPAMEALEDFRQRDPLEYHLLVLTDREGKVIAASPRGAAIRSSYRDEPGWNAAFAHGEGKVFISDIAWDPAMSVFTLNVGLPVRHKGKTAGVLLVLHTVGRLFKSVTDVHIGRTDHTMLASSDGTLLFCPVFEIRNHTLSKVLTREIFKEEAGWTFTREDVHYPGPEALNGFAPVHLQIDNLSPESLGGKRWYIFTSQNPTETYEPLRSLMRWTALSAAIGIVILVVLATLVSRTVVRPITLLKDQAHDIIERIQALPMDRRKTVSPYVLPKINIHTGDEIEDLAGSFSEMAGVLERARRVLTETTHRLEEMAITDDLTGLYNRRHVLNELRAEFSRSVRFGLHLSCLAIDLDFFKDVNDRYGHLMGDQVLRQMSALFQKNFREPDILARIGGEEFLVILPQTAIQGAQVKAELLRKQVEQYPFTVGHDKTIRMTISIGVSAYPDERIQNIDQLIKLADDALYQSKKNGRNRVSRG